MYFVEVYVHLINLTLCLGDGILPTIFHLEYNLQGGFLWVKYALGNFLGQRKWGWVQMDIIQVEENVEILEEIQE